LNKEELVGVATFLGYKLFQKKFVKIKLNKYWTDKIIESDYFMMLFETEVRYVNVFEIFKKYNCLWIGNFDKDLSDELIEQKRVTLALHPKDYMEMANEDNEPSIIGRKAVYKGDIIGIIEGYSGYSPLKILQISLNNGEELLVPDVQNYVEKKNDDCVELINISSLLKI